MNSTQILLCFVVSHSGPIPTHMHEEDLSGEPTTPGPRSLCSLGLSSGVTCSERRSPVTLGSTTCSLHRPVIRTCSWSLLSDMPSLASGRAGLVLFTTCHQGLNCTGIQKVANEQLLNLLRTNACLHANTSNCKTRADCCDSSQGL